VLEYCRYGDGHAFVCVGFFSVEVSSLYYVMVDFDGRLLFFGHFCSPRKNYWKKGSHKRLVCNDLNRAETGK
jgi:hypothetical protein